jgi:RND family efflux transporter MFP subunit
MVSNIQKQICLCRHNSEKLGQIADMQRCECGEIGQILLQGFRGYLMKRHFQFLVSGIALAAVTGCVVFATIPLAKAADAQTKTDTQTKPGGSLTAVSVVKVTTTHMVRSFSANGSVNARDLVQVSPLNNGLIISEVFAKEGDTVKKGDVLAKLNTDLLEAQIREKEAAIVGYSAAYESAHAIAERARSLADSRAIATETLEQRVASDVSAKATLDQAKASLDTLRVQLDQATLVAPVDGVIAAPPLLVGSISSTATPMFQIIADNALEIYAKVPQQYLVLLKAGDTVEIANDDSESGGKVLEGKVRGIAEKVDSVTRLGTVYVSVPAESLFRTGMFARVTFLLPPLKALTVPEAALIWQAGSPAVYVVSSDNIVHAVKLTTGIRQDGMVAVESGLKGGETVVLEGASFLTDGAEVMISNVAAEIAK